MRKRICGMFLVVLLLLGGLFSAPRSEITANAWTLYLSPFSWMPVLQSKEAKLEREELKAKIDNRDSSYDRQDAITSKESLREKLSAYFTTYGTQCVEGDNNNRQTWVFKGFSVPKQNTQTSSQNQVSQYANDNIETPLSDNNVFSSPDPSADLWVTLDPHNGASIFQVKVSELELFLAVYEIEEVPGYHFLGWATENGNTVSNYKILGGKTIYAVWADDERSRIMDDYPWSP